MHKYTLSERAHKHLITLLARRPSNKTIWRRGAVIEFDGYGSTTNVNPVKPQYEGVGWALTLLARTYDFQEWTPKPSPSTHLYYDPVDTIYLNDLTQDLEDDPSSVTLNNQLVYEKELTLQRHQYSLSLDHQARIYYSNLLVYLGIELPTRPSIANPVIMAHIYRDNLTTRVGFCIEAIGTSHILLPAGYQTTIQKPNYRKNTSRQESDRVAQLVRELAPDSEAKKEALRKAKLYGNHAHTSYEPKEWRKLPSRPAKFTQADVDYCCLPHVRLEDLAQEAVSLNPSLTFKATRAIPTPVVSNSNDRSLPKRELITTPPTERPIHTCKGRDVTPAVLEAYHLHYELGKNFSYTKSIQTDYGIPYNTLRILVHREHIWRLANDANKMEEVLNSWSYIG